jgi:hypothetical protein
MNRNSKLAAFAGGVILSALAASPAWADKFKRPVAVFAGLDKITGRIISFEVAINETVQFGSLQITPRVCYNRPPTETPRTDAFAQVDEVETDKTIKPIFSGWMFADSPGLHGIEHPVYDLWLTECKGDGQLIKEAPEVAEALPDDADPDATPAKPGATPTATAKPKPRKPKPKAAQLAPPGDVGEAPGAPMHIGR